MKVLMVDLDGTLFDTKKVNYEAYREALSSYEYNIDYDYYCQFCNGRYYLDFLPQIATNDNQILSEIHETKKLVYSKYLGSARVNRALVDIIRNSRNTYKIALITTASKKNTFDILNRFDMMSLFDLVITSEDVYKSKPNPEGYLKAMKTFGAEPNDCIIFEDSHVGIEAAEKSGANVFIVKGYN